MRRAALILFALLWPLAAWAQGSMGGGGTGGGVGSGTVTQISPGLSGCLTFTPNPITVTGTIDLTGGALSNACLANSSVTISGHVLALGGTLSLASGDISGLGYFATGTDAANLTGTIALTRLALTSAHLYVGNGGGNPADVALSGDCTLANTGAVTCTKTGGVAFGALATGTSASSLTSGQLPAGSTIAVTSQSGTTYTLASTDCMSKVLFTSASAVTVTVPNSLAVGCQIALEQNGAGAVTLSAAAGATIHSAHSFTKTFAQYSTIGLTVDTNSGGTSAIYNFTGDGA